MVKSNSLWICQAFCFEKEKRLYINSGQLLCGKLIFVHLYSEFAPIMNYIVTLLVKQFLADIKQISKEISNNNLKYLSLKRLGKINSSPINW